MTVIVGGVISGSWVTPRPVYPTAPMMVMTMATTAAKIGRSMKKWLTFMRPGPQMREGKRGMRVFIPASWNLRPQQAPPPTPSDRDPLGLDLQAGTHALQAVGDHPVVAGNTFAHDAQPVGQRSQLDVPARHRAVVADDVDVLVGLVGADGTVGNQDRRVVGAARDADAREQARREQTGLVGQNRARPERARALVEPVVEEIEPRLVRKSALVGQRDLDEGADVGGPDAALAPAACT